MKTDKTPDELLAQGIVVDLRKEQLLSTKQLDELSKSLTSGTMKKEDWQIIVEIAVDAEKSRKDAKKN